jgi:hypothetical protein
LHLLRREIQKANLEHRRLATTAMRVTSWRKSFKRALAACPTGYLTAYVRNFFTFWNQPHPPLAPEIVLYLDEIRSRLSKPDYNQFIAEIESLGVSDEQTKPNRNNLFTASARHSL